MVDIVKIQEVGPRDGLQNEKMALRPEQRYQLIERLIKSGLSRIQVGSFVNPRLVPQMAQTEEVVKLLGKRKNMRFSALVLNMRGLEAAIGCGVEHVEIFVSASETHSLKNTGMSVDRALESAEVMIKEAILAGLTIGAGVMCAFGCEFEGKIKTDVVKRIVDRFMSLEPNEISLADTTGHGTSELLEKTLQILAMDIPLNVIALHLHDTYGHADENVVKALDMGVRMFDSSVGGLGGCPFIPGARGNIATERIVNLVEEKGFDSGVNIDALHQARTFLERLLKAEKPTSLI